MKSSTSHAYGILRIASAVMVLILSAAAILYAVLGKASVPASTVPESDTAAELAACRAALTEKEDEIRSFESQLAGYQKTISDYEIRIATLLNASSDVDAMTEELKNQINALNARITALNTQLSAARLEAQALTEKMQSYDSLAVLDGQDKLNRLNALMNLLTESAPVRNLEKEVYYEVTDPVTGALQTLTAKIPYEQYPDISLYYEDLTTGYVISYNSAEVRYTASVVKAPYIYCVLREIAAFQQRKYYYDAAGNRLYDQNGNKLYQGDHPNYNADGTLIYLPGEEKYDLSRIWTYDEETMFKEGSGNIQKEQSGFQLTYRELIEYVIRYSDNIAFSEIKTLFGAGIYNTEARTLGVKGYGYGFMQLSAADCGLWLKAMNNFMEQDTVQMDETRTYGQWLRQMMQSTTFNLLIPSGASPSQVAHKYGWDENSFHDMGIVYDEHPYLLVIMTDLDTGTAAENNEVIKYIVSLVQAVNKIHKSLYPT